jgi:hypothetical protein
VSAPMTQQVPSMRLELVKALLRRYVPAAIVESVVKRAIVTNRLDVEEMSHEALEVVVASSVAGLRRVVDPKRLAMLMIELSECLAEYSDEFESNPGSVRGFSGTIRIARHGK